jgi:uncharacterized membrane protein YoaK (UPF0700 family)
LDSYPLAFPHIVVIFAIAFAAAMQNSGFHRVGKRSYQSIVTTGNLRSLWRSLLRCHVSPHEPEASDQARALSAVCHSFVSALFRGGADRWFGEARDRIPDHPALFALLCCVSDPNTRADATLPSSAP